MGISDLGNSVITPSIHKKKTPEPIKIDPGIFRLKNKNILIYF